MPVGTIPRREHVVTAALVGTVVVVVGFASGLGLTHPAGAAPPPQSPTTAPAPPPAAAAAPGDQGPAGAGGGGSGPVDYVGTPAGVGVGGNPMPAVTTDVPTPSTPPPTGPATPTTTPPTSITTQPACQPGLLTGVLNQVTSIVDGLPVLGSLTPQLTEPLLGTCSSSTVDGSTPAPTTAPGLLPLPLLNGGGS